MTPRELDVIFGSGQASADLLCEAIYSVLHPETAEGDDSSNNVEAA